MTARIENHASVEDMVRMTLGTDRGAWHSDPGFGSDLWLLGRAGRVDGQTAGTVERMAREALQWLITDGLARSVDVRAHRNGKNRIDYMVTVRRPDGSLSIVEEAWHGISA